ncbi:MAG: tail fiber assembly protein [Acinetobacter sp.]
MINLMNFREKTKLTEDEQQQASGFGVIFLCDDVGNDWYESQSQFAEETIKVMYAENGVICAVSDDVSKLWPLNMSVAEVKATKANNAVDSSGSWVYCDGKVKARQYTADEMREEAEQRKTQLLAMATSVIDPLQDAVDLDMATEDEATSLTAWRKYRVMLSRVDTGTAPDIDWPVAPSI